MTKEEYEKIINLEKSLDEKSISFPKGSKKLLLNAYSKDGREYIKLMIRGNTFDASKVTNHSMYADNAFLLRIDLGDRIKHKNPAVNGEQETIVGSHVHYFVEGFGDGWAMTLEDYCIENNIPYESLKNKYDVFELFCSKLNIEKDWSIVGGLQQGEF